MEGQKRKPYLLVPELVSEAPPLVLELELVSMRLDLPAPEFVLTEVSAAPEGFAVEEFVRLELFVLLKPELFRS